jgi:hypothetical protein
VAGETRLFRRRLTARETRWLIYLLVVIGIAAWKFVPRPWHPALTLDSPHYRLYSTATREQTEATARTLELLYTAYSNRFGTLPGFQRDHPRLQVKLFKDRPEFRRINPGLGWAEAFYRAPYCRAYFSASEINPYHWILHESVHQLNQEVAHLHLAKWLEEGLAEYFSTSRLGSNELALGHIDLNTYPVWWIDQLATSADLPANLRNGSVIPLRSIITHRGGPSMNREFNLYYLHWWTLTHFIFESPRHRDQALTLVQRGGGLDPFERTLGPVESVQKEWHAYVRRLKALIAGTDLSFHRTGKVPEEAAPSLNP